MKKNIVSVAVGSAMILGTSASLAAPFNSFDPKSMAMGGAGVAVSNPAAAPFFNPALLSVADQSDDFALALPIVGARYYDPDDFADAVDNFDDTVMDDLDTSIKAYNAAPGDSTSVIAAMDATDAEMRTLDNKPFQFEVGVGTTLSLPGKELGFAFSASASANAVGVFDYEDSDTFNKLSVDLTLLDACYALGSPADAACIEAAPFNYVDTDPLSPTFGEITFTAQSDTGATSDIQSKVRVVGVAIGELGLSFSREMSIYGSNMAVGLTPKMVSVTVFDYEANADSADTGEYDDDNYIEEYSDFNLDFGLAKDYSNGWRTGFVIKNLISQEYDAYNKDPVTGSKYKTGTTIELKPQARFGISRHTGLTTLALDVDLTENEALGLGEKSRYVALGAEFNLIGTLQLRAGYRADTVNSERNVASVGLGVSFFGAHMDLAAAGNDNELGAALQLGFRF